MFPPMKKWSTAPSFPDPPGLRIEAASAGYGGTPVFAGVTLDVRPGRTAAVIGPSGCGKTTLLHCAAGLRPLSAGQIFLGGKPVDGPSTEIGYVFQNHNLLPWYTALDNAALPPFIRGAGKAAAREKAEFELRRLGLASLAGRYPGELSGGQNRRVALARALAADPSCLLLDAPFSSVDEFSREGLQELAAEVLRSSSAVGLLVTHGIDEAVFLGDEVYVMSAGEKGGPASLHPVRKADGAFSRRGAAVRLTAEFREACGDVRRRLGEFLEADRG